MSALSVRNISKSFGKLSVLDDISLEVGKHELVALLGESGSGKTTLLRIIAGFEFAESGSISLKNIDLINDSTYVKPEDRKIGVIFQDYALFPHLSVRKNIAYGLSKKDYARVDELLHIFELVEQADKMPSEISGGQQQRVAIARALAVQPDLLLLDEPFSNLDQTLRRKVRAEIRRVQQSFNIPMVLVTHDPDDALELADKIAVLQNGKIIQFDTPQAIYFNPVNEYVASLFGPYSMFNQHVIRPEQIDFSQQDFKAEVIMSTPHVKGNIIQLKSGNDQLIAHTPSYHQLVVGQKVTFGIKKSKP